MPKITKALLSLPYPAEHLSTIANALEPAEVILYPVGSAADLARHLPDADVAILDHPPAPDILATAARLRWMHCDLVGMEKVFTPALARRGDLLLTNARGRSSNALAEQVLMLLLALSHRLPRMYDAQKKREWLPARPPGAATLRGSTAGILGTGSIGCAVAALCAAFSMRTLGYQRAGKAPNPLFDRCVSGREGLEFLLRESDFVILALPLTDGTKGILGAKEFALMKRSAFLVNIARGGLLDEDALVAAVRSGAIAGAGLDTVSVEPLPASSPLWDLENVLLTHHKTPEQPEKTIYSVQLIVDNIAAYRAGAELRNLVPPHHAYTSG